MAKPSNNEKKGKLKPPTKAKSPSRKAKSPPESSQEPPPFLNYAIIGNYGQQELFARTVKRPKRKAKDERENGCSRYSCKIFMENGKPAQEKGAYDVTSIRVPATEPLRNQIYINASLIPVVNLSPYGVPDHMQKRRWIAASAPSKKTLCPFLVMLLEPFCSDSSPRHGRVVSIVQLTTESETKKGNVLQYIPPEGSSVRHPYSSRAILLKTVKQIDMKSYKVSQIFIRWEHEPEEVQRKVLHFHYLNFPDNGVPCKKFLAFVSKAEECVGDVIVHCRAGCGRTGTYVTLATLAPHVSFFSTYKSNGKRKCLNPTLCKFPGLKPFHVQIKSTEDIVGAVVDAYREHRCHFVYTNDRNKQAAVFAVVPRLKQDQLMYIYRVLLDLYRETQKNQNSRVS